MNLHTDNKYVPIIGIQEFREGQTAGRKELLYNELHGERHISKPHKHDFFIIVLFEQAKGTHNIDFQDYEIGKSNQARFLHLHPQHPEYYRKYPPEVPLPE